jgi:hypothetical protein
MDAIAPVFGSLESFKAVSRQWQLDGVHFRSSLFRMDSIVNFVYRIDGMTL